MPGLPAQRLVGDVAVNGKGGEVDEDELNNGGEEGHPLKVIKNGKNNKKIESSSMVEGRRGGRESSSIEEEESSGEEGELRRRGGNGLNGNGIGHSGDGLRKSVTKPPTTLSPSSIKNGRNGKSHQVNVHNTAFPFSNTVVTNSVEGKHLKEKLKGSSVARANGLVSNDSNQKLINQDYLAEAESDSEEELLDGESGDLIKQVNGIRKKVSEHKGIFQVDDIPDNNFVIGSSGASHNSLIASSSSTGGSDDGSGLVTTNLNPNNRRLPEHKSSSKMTKREIITVAILCFVNLINYMDRYTVAGILEKIKCDFKISNGEAGLLQTAFVVSYMIFAPVFGYLGDRYSRRYLMAAGVLLWSLTTLIGSFMTSFGWFIAFRALVGIGEASYSTIAPTIISDLFVDDRRSTMLTLFYFAIPVGSGMGYIVGAQTAHLAQAWQWGLRVTPIMGALAVLLILFVMTDPSRGESENANLQPTSYKEDIVYLSKNRSFMLSTLGFTCVTFVAGALAWWGPIFIHLGIKANDPDSAVTTDDVAFKFGLIAMISGLVGVPLGSFLSQKLRERNARADPLVCAFGLLASTPFIFFAAITANFNTNLCYALIFFGEVLLNLNWSIVADVVLYVVIPTRRSTAEAMQILLSHTLGDAGSPYLIGQVSDWLKPVIGHSAGFNGTMVNTTDGGCDDGSTDFGSGDYVQEFKSLQYSLFITSFVEVLGGLFFLVTAWYVVEDKLRADKAIAGDELIKDGSEPTHYDADEPHSSEMLN